MIQDDSQAADAISLEGKGQTLRLKGGTMLTKIDKGAVEAANYFQGEVLEIMPDIPREELFAMVGDYIYYQQADVGKEQARAVVRETCVKK
ncbi:MAG TPA: hypothetical protein DCS07_17615 [Bdellovibrionales bacterium]|nr:hypothetical protein [Bdellovibrionales bacterium]